MEKLFQLKEWLTVPKAAQHMAIVFGEDVNEADVLRFALDGQLQLSVYFVNQTSARCGESIDYDEVEWGEYYDKKEDKPIRYTENPKLNNGQFLRLNQEITHLKGLWDLSMNGEERQEIENQFQKLTGGPAVTDRHEDGAFVKGSDGKLYQLQRGRNRNFDCMTGGLPDDVLLVVRTDALAEFEQRISGASLDGPVNPKERNTLLTIIGVMAKDGYGHDLNRPYEAAKEIKEAADKLGIKISDDTIANKLKEAKNILAEKTE